MTFILIVLLGMLLEAVYDILLAFHNTPTGHEDNRGFHRDDEQP